MTGVDIYVGDGIQGLKLELYDTLTQVMNSTEIIRNSQKSCFSYFNSSFFKSKSLVIDSIKGCVDNNQLNYFPFLEFTYSFSQCPMQVIYQMKTVSSTIMMSSTISVTTSSSFNPFVSNYFTSDTATLSLKSSTIANSITVSSSTLSYSTNINYFAVFYTSIDLSSAIPIINTITFLETSKLIYITVSLKNNL